MWPTVNRSVALTLYREARGLCTTGNADDGRTCHFEQGQPYVSIFSVTSGHISLLWSSRFPYTAYTHNVQTAGDHCYLFSVELPLFQASPTPFLQGINYLRYSKSFSYYGLAMNMNMNMNLSLSVNESLSGLDWQPQQILKKRILQPL